MACNEAAIVRACKADGDYAQVAKDCNVSSAGFLDVGPLSQIGARKATCARLYAIKVHDQASQLFESMDAKMRAFLEYVLLLKDKPNDNLQYFQGEMVDCLFALIYLLRNPEIKQQACMILRPLRKVLQAHRRSDEEIDWNDFAVTWEPSPSEYALKVPGNNMNSFLRQIAKCLRQKRFFFSLLALFSELEIQADGTELLRGHASLLFYDKETGLLERFDPYQSKSKAYHTEELDRKLANVFSVLPGFKRFLGPPPLGPEERQGLQSRAEGEIEQFTDPRGFCIPWSVLYAEARLSSPLQEPESIPQLLMFAAAQKNKPLTKVIRNYTHQMETLKSETHRKFLELEDRSISETSFLYNTVLELLVDSI